MKFLNLFLLMSFGSFVFANQNTYEGKNVELLSKIDLTKSGKSAREGNDCWGWTDPVTGQEIALMGLNSKTSIVDITDPKNPVHLGDIATQTYNSTWRDIKIYKNYAYIVSEAYGHGMQIYNLENLRLIDRAAAKLNPEMFKPDFVYKGFRNAHNIFINEDSGYAYAVGTNTCDGGLHIMDLKNPLDPKFSTCVGRRVYEKPTNFKHGDAYTHDVQCVIYNGPHIKYLGREICISSNEDTVNVVDVTDKNRPYQISVSTYTGVAYTHQGWMSEDHKYFLLGDELDEINFGIDTKTFVWDISNLENIRPSFEYAHPTKATDHNLYVHEGLIYQANYLAGIRILDGKNLSQNRMEEIAYLDTNPESNKAGFGGGTWSVYPYFKSKSIIASTLEGELWVFKLDLP